MFLTDREQTQKVLPRAMTKSQDRRLSSLPHRGQAHLLCVDWMRPIGTPLKFE